MAENRTLVTTFTATEDMDANLESIERSFRPGERGEVVFKLDRTKAQSAGRLNIQQDAAALSEDLERRGMIPWDDHDLVELDWTSKVFRIRFVQGKAPSSMYQTPSFIGVGIMVAARASAVVAPAVIRGGIFTKFGRLFGKAGSKILQIGRKLTRSSALSLVGTGLLVWSLIDMDSLVQVFKWAGKKVSKAAGGLAKGVFGTPVLIGIGVMVAGLFLVSRRQ